MNDTCTYVLVHKSGKKIKKECVKVCRAHEEYTVTNTSFTLIYDLSK